MALQKTFILSGTSSFNTEHGVIRTGSSQLTMDCYVKVESVGGTKEFVTAVVSFTDNDKSFEKSYSFTPNMDGNNFVKQAYEYLKTLPEFADSTDV